MTVRRFLRHVGVGVMLAGLALAIAVLTLPAGWMQWRVDGDGRTVYLQADCGTLTFGRLMWSSPISAGQLSDLPTPRQAEGISGFLASQFETQTLTLYGWSNFDDRTGWRRSVLGVGVERLYATISERTTPVWWREEYRLPAWLFALPGLIWISLRLRRRIVKRSRPTGFDVLQAREGDG